MSDWENEETEVVVASTVVTKGAWDDEDADEDEVKSSWEDSDDGAEKAAPAKPVAAPPKKKSTLAQKLAERKEEEERKAAEKAARLANKQADDEDLDETPEERKARLAQAVIDSDLQNAKNLFGVSTPQSSSKIETMNPSTRPEFDDYVKECMAKFSKFESKTQYSYFVEALVRGLLVPLNVEDTRRISSSISAMINEKQKATKTTVASKKKPKKAMLGKAGDGMDTTNYDGE
ncbi:eukaryotic translation initiation factor 3 subunit J [Powellomyces hirtus]|nr:eukaryotic translation initiation factor 3 subunit J [Powellomyces hirtus]